MVARRLARDTKMDVALIHTCAAANVRVLGFCLIGRYIDDIVLAQVVIGRIQPALHY